MKKGVVKWFNDGKGFGFINAEGVNGDIFCHWQNITGDGFKTLVEGQTVTFELVEGPKGLAAKDIVKGEVLSEV